MKFKAITILFLFIISIACNDKDLSAGKNKSSIFEKVENVPDSIKVDDIVNTLLDNNFDVINMVQEGIPHEFNHFIYEPTREYDPYKDTPLRLTIDEGFACYYTYKYFDGKISKAQAVEQMTEKDWDWYLLHEKEIFNKCSQYFYFSEDEDPLRKLGDELDAPKTLFYWLGFRIVEFYVNAHGPDSWKDIYNLSVKEVLEKSQYEKYIDGNI